MTLAARRAQFYALNLADLATLEVSSEVPSLPAANLRSESPGEVWRSLDEVTDLVFSWAAPVQADFACLVQWREGVVLAASDTVELFLDEVSQGGPMAAAVAAGIGYEVRLLPSAPTFSSLRWRITLGAATPYLQVGRAWVALGWSPEESYAWAHPWRWLDGSLAERNPRSGRVESDPGGRWRRQTLQFPLARDDDVEAFEAIEAVGLRQQIALLVDPGRPARTTLIGRLAEATDFAPEQLGLTAKTLTLEEDT